MPIPAPQEKVKYKYKISEYLNGLTRQDYSVFMNCLEEKVGITKKTLYNWRNIKQSDAYSIPSEKLDRLAKLIGLSSADQLKNYSVDHIKTIGATRHVVTGLSK